MNITNDTSRFCAFLREYFSFCAHKGLCQRPLSRADIAAATALDTFQPVKLFFVAFQIAGLDSVCHHLRKQTDRADGCASAAAKTGRHNSICSFALVHCYKRNTAAGFLDRHVKIGE